MSNANVNSAATYATYPSLRDRAVVVTGGASGIGASMVAHFARQGARVAFLDVQDVAARELIDELKAEGVAEPQYFRCDLSDIAALRDSVQRAIAALGAVDVLVNNAANDERHKIEEVTPEYWDASMAVNLRPQFFMIQAVLPAMKAAGRGSIINMSSIAWMIPSTGVPVYIAAKAAIVGLTRTLAHELWAGRHSRECSSAGRHRDGEAEAAGLYARVQGGDHGEPGAEAGHSARGCGAAGAVSGGG